MLALIISDTYLNDFLNLCMTECLWTNFPGIAGDNIPQAARRLNKESPEFDPLF